MILPPRNCGTSGVGCPIPQQLATQTAAQRRQLRPLTAVWLLIGKSQFQKSFHPTEHSWWAATRALAWKLFQSRLVPSLFPSFLLYALFFLCLTHSCLKCPPSLETEALEGTHLHGQLTSSPALPLSFMFYFLGVFNAFPKSRLMNKHSCQNQSVWEVLCRENNWGGNNVSYKIDRGESGRVDSLLLKNCF